MITSGRYVRGKNPKYNINIETEEGIVALERAIARGESIAITGNAVVKYSPLFRHPLPVSEHRYKHEATLRRCLSTLLDKQAAAAVTMKNAWVLEEVYMRGAPVDVPNLNGFTPLHLAVQGNDFECMMVLFNIGVDCNAETVSGITPLYLGIYYPLSLSVK